MSIMYNETVLEHFNNPRNVGEIENADAVGEAGSAVCGDSMKIYLTIKDDVIEDIKFKTFGCGAAVASSSMGTEMIKGKTIEEALKITSQDIADALGGLPAEKLHCSVLTTDALKNAIEEYRQKNPK
jgi:nitrogen fixation NifU-like protein